MPPQRLKQEGKEPEPVRLGSAAKPEGVSLRYAWQRKGFQCFSELGREATFKKRAAGLKPMVKSLKYKKTATSFTLSY